MPAECRVKSPSFLSPEQIRRILWYLPICFMLHDRTTGFLRIKTASQLTGWRQPVARTRQLCRSSQLNRNAQVNLYETTTVYLAYMQRRTSMILLVRSTVSLATTIPIDLQVAIFNDG
ncbi:hypothetical protein BDR03DRAFT_953121 [Suillus americanus]|nr:hypothetical protein BDR03DRAFT_953121 [Suillus americanus]